MAPVDDSYGSPVASVHDSYGSPVSPVDNSYGSPISPLEDTYSAAPPVSIPQPPDFISPEPQYGFTPCLSCPTSPTTPTPSQAPDSYGSPVEDPISAADAYGIPSPDPVSAPDSYGIPSQDPIAAPDSYGIPSTDLVSAPDSYGIPSQDPIAAPDSYGIPSADPVSATDSYGKPLQDPIVAPDSFGIPPLDPIDTLDAFGKPIDNFLPNSDYHIDPFDETVTFEGAFTPVSASDFYGTPDASNSVNALNSNYNSIKRQMQKDILPKGLPLPVKGIVINIGVENNLIPFPVSSPTESRENPSQPKFNRQVSLPSYNDNLPTYNHPNPVPSSLPSYQDTYDPFVFQAENAAKPTVKTTQRPASTTPRATTRATTRASASLPTRLPSNINPDVELIEIPDFVKPISANQILKNKTNTASSFSFTQFGDSAPFGFVNSNEESFGFSNNLNLNSLENNNNVGGSELFNPFGVSFASGFGEKKPTTRTPTQRTSTTPAIPTLKSTTRRPQQNFQQQISPFPNDARPASGFIEQENTRPQSPTGGVGVSNGFQSTPSPFGNSIPTQTSFFGGTITPLQFVPSTARPTTRTTRPTTRPTRSTTRRQVLLQQSIQPTINIDDGLKTEISLGFNQPIFFGSPEKLQISSLNEITGASGIFFSTPSSQFVTPEDFATPVPKNLQTSDPNSQGSPRRPNSGERFKANQIATTGSPTFAQQNSKPLPSVELTVPSSIETNSETEQGKNNLFSGSTTFGGQFLKMPQKNNQKKSRGSKQSFGQKTDISPGFIPGGNSLQPANPSQGRVANSKSIETDISPPENDIQEVTDVQPRPKQQTIDIQPRKESEETLTVFSRRNMLMNIILRPGGGDKDKALPRPKVEVTSEGANVILVRLTFPENENIHGLRAFTPTDPKELNKFDELKDAFGPEARIERIQGLSSEESFEDELINSRDLKKTEKLTALRPNAIMSSPTRPTRPPKNENTVTSSFSYLPPPSAPAPNPAPTHSYLPPSVSLTKPSLNNFPPPIKPQQKGFNSNNNGFFNLKLSAEDTSSEREGKIKPRNIQNPPQQLNVNLQERPRAYFYPVTESFRSQEGFSNEVRSTEFLFRDTPELLENEISGEKLKYKPKTKWGGQIPPRPKSPPTHLQNEPLLGNHPQQTLHGREHRRQGRKDIPLNSQESKERKKHNFFGVRTFNYSQFK